MTGFKAEKTIWACVTRRCNFSCVYCYQSDRSIAPPLAPYMTDAVMERALEWALEWLPKGKLNLNWYGGEPLLLFDLIERWTPRWKHAFSGERSVRIGLTTNGALLTKAVREWLDQENVGILLSMDGPPRLHDQTRVTGDGHGSSSLIPSAEEVLEWRPKIEIAWQLDPRVKFRPEHIDEMISRGYKNLNFNVNFCVEWDAPSLGRLERFFEHVGRMVFSGKVGSNWKSRVLKLLNNTERQVTPCGTGQAMVGLSPEGWLYPSQEMVYTVFLPDRAPGTAERYKIGDVSKRPVIDREALERASKIRTDQLKPPSGYDCASCWVRVACLGGCHCKYAGADGVDPSNRYDITPGHCPSLQATFSGLIRGAIATRKLGELLGTVTREPTVADRLSMIEKRLGEMSTSIQRTPLVRLEMES